jgi:membrane associated rhomboid family serine protease
MGIYDREYYRREGPSFLGSFTGQGRACKWLIVLNVIFFLLQAITPAQPRLPQGRGPRLEFDEEGKLLVGRDEEPRKPEFGETYGVVTEALQLDTDAVKHGQVWRLLTYAFLHGGIMHILFNMLFLWWFGHEMEELYGTKEFATFYVISAILGGMVFTLTAWLRASNALCVGASGAVTAVMVLYAFHYPTRLIYFWGIIPIPIWLFVGFQVFKDLFTFVSGAPTLVAVNVHLAGAVFGFTYYKFNWRVAPLWQALLRFRLPQRRQQPRLRIYEEEPTPRRPVVTPPPAEIDEHLEAKVDAVLEKVARHGRDSLSESEKALLVRASEVYKRKQKS